MKKKNLVLEQDNGLLQFKRQFNFHQPEKHTLTLHKLGKLRFTVGYMEFDHYHFTLLLLSLKEQDFYQEMMFDHVCLPSKGVRGPFSLATITPADFQQIDSKQFKTDVESIIDTKRWRTDDILADQRQQVEVLIQQAIKLFTHFYKLSKVATYNSRQYTTFDYDHAWSHSIQEFHEYILTNPKTQQIAVVNLYYE